jgi:hypothetical protein
VAGRTQALPGGVEVTISLNSGTSYDIDLSWGVIETRAYLYTLVNTYMEESAPSPATLISPTYIQSVSITRTIPSFTGYQPYSATYIYRTFGGTAAYLKVAASYSGLHDVYVDNTHEASNVGTALVSAEWTPPPSTIAGLKLMPQGWFVGFNNNVLYMSEPYRPHTWPYSITFPNGIRGVCPGAQGLVVTTFDRTYLVSGQHPASAMQTELPIPVGGVSHVGMCNIEGMVAFVSQDGIVLVEGTRASLEFSQKLFTREVWRARYGDILGTMKLSYHDGCMYATTPLVDGLGAYGFCVRVDEATGAYTRLNIPISAVARLPILDTLYFTRTDDGVSGRNIYIMDTGAGSGYSWRSKDFIFPSPEKFGAFYIRCNSTASVLIYAEDQLFYSVEAATGYHRVPAGQALKWSVLLSSSQIVYEFVMAQTMGELRGA